MWPVYRWPGWEWIGTSARTFLPCPVGLRPLTGIGLTAAKSPSMDHSTTTEPTHTGTHDLTFYRCDNQINEATKA